MDMLKTINKATQGMRDRIMLMMGRAVLSALDDRGGIQVAQAMILEDEIRGDLERLQDYGFTSVPLAGADVFVAFPGGNRDNGVILRVDDRRYRMAALKNGEVAVYTDEGDFIHFQRDNTIEVKTRHLVINAEDDVTINTEKFELNASESIAMTTKSHTVDASEAIDMTTARLGQHANSLDMTSKEGGDMDAVLTGSMRATDSFRADNDVTANTGAVSLRKHVHEGVSPGNATTQKPVGG